MRKNLDPQRPVHLQTPITVDDDETRFTNGGKKRKTRVIYEALVN